MRIGRGACAGWLAAVAVALPVQAEPMQLEDATPRWVVVQFEDSPNDRPDRLDAVYTKPFAAWLEPDALGRVTVRVDAQVLERSLFSENDPVPGSFTDYVWVFDPATGEVVDASFSGSFAFHVNWGITSSEVRARVSASMRTGRSGGVRGPESVWGRRLHAWCTQPGRDGCRAVSDRAYDPERGYVNAIGYLAIDSPLTRFVTFSALGEARFSELPSEMASTPPVATAPEPAPGWSGAAPPVAGARAEASP